MQRRLEELGTTYRDVLNEVRQCSARRLVANTNLGVGEVAFLLGFEGVNSFTRAFQSWEGTTPANWRERAIVPRGSSRGERRSATLGRAQSESPGAHLSD